MNHLFKILVFVILSSFVLNAQPVKIWSKLYGGNNTELAYGGTVVNDSLIAFVGSSNSTNIANKGLTDMTIAVVNKNGNLKNIKTFGSPQADLFNAVDVLPNGNLICVGQANGSGGDVTANYGLIDGHILLYNPLTNARLWGKNFGGTNNDQIFDVKFLEQGKIIFVGSSKSNDKDLPPNVGLTDAFVGTIDESGNLVSVKSFSGSKDDIAKKIAIIDAGSFYVTGETTSSNEGAYIGLANKGKKDIFVFKLNRNSNKILAYMLGGPGDDVLVESVVTPDKGVIHVLNVSTSGGDIDSLIGGKDIFAIKYDELGNQMWKRIIGGTKDDEAVAARINSAGELIITATSNSTDRDIKLNYGDKDVMLFKLNAKGELIASNNYGGSRGDAAGALILDNSDTYLVSSSFSLNNDLPNTNTAADFWILKLFECSTTGTKYISSICFGDTVKVGNQLFYAGNTSGRVILSKAGQFNCDSIIDVDIQLNSATTEFLRDTFCNEGTTTINNVIFDKNNKSQVFHLKNVNGCDSTLIVELTFDDPIAIIDSMLHSDNGTNNGYVHLAIVGGRPPYKFQWSNGSRTLDIDNLKFGTYTVTVTDDESCVKTFSFVVKNTVLSRDLFNQNLSIKQQGHYIIVDSKFDISDFQIFNLQGSSMLHSQPGINKFEIEIQNWLSGIYEIKLSSITGEQAIHKLVITK